METVTLPILFVLLFLLILISSFFSASETAMMALNRYRLRHLARGKHKAAQRVTQLLMRPDRLLGVVLIGNTFANIMASAVATVIGAKLYGDLGIAVATIILTFVVLVFAEVAPKTIAASYPESLAFAVSFPLKWLLKLLYPVIWLVSALSNGLLTLFRLKTRRDMVERLTREELHTLVSEAGEDIPEQHQDMLLAILTLEKITVEDVMVPRNHIVGIDLEDEWSVIMHQLVHSQYTRIPIYRGEIDNIKGIIHLRVALNLLAKNALSKKSLLDAADPACFIPESTSLNAQLLNFRDNKIRIALVVDEYGDIQGLVTLEDILTEIIGEFTSGMASFKGVRPQGDGSFLVDGSINIRDLNRLTEWEFSTEGPKTFGGLIIEDLELIPESEVCTRISGYQIEVLKVKNHRIRVVRVIPPLKTNQKIKKSKKKRK